MTMKIVSKGPTSVSRDGDDRRSSIFAEDGRVDGLEGRSEEFVEFEAFERRLDRKHGEVAELLGTGYVGGGRRELERRAHVRAT
jgi:hypothetical protein